MLEVAIPNLEIHGMPLGRHKTPWNLERWVYVGGAGTRIDKVAESIRSGLIVLPHRERIELIILFKRYIDSMLEMGASFFSVESYLGRMNLFVKWIDDFGRVLGIGTVIALYIEWTDVLFHRVKVEKSIGHSTALGYASAVGDVLRYVLDLEYSILNQTRLIGGVRYKGKCRSVQSDKQSLETTFEFGHLLQDVCDGLTIDVLWGPLPARIPLRGDRELRRYSGLTPAEYRKCKPGAKPNYERLTAYESDRTLRTRYPLANLRVVAELLMFIGQTGMNLAQAHRLELRHFCYASDVDGYKVRDYKQRRGGEVLFEIYREYRSHFERYLDWRRSVFPDEVRLFPFPHRQSHENEPPALDTIKRACAEAGIKWVSPRALRSTRVNWLLRRSGDADLTSEMAQHSKQTLLRNYEKPSHQVAIAEITRFWKEADPHLATNTPIAAIAVGVCDGKPEVVSFKPQSAPAPDCLHPSGCLWCAHHRDIDSFGYVWALACFRHLKTIEVARYRPPIEAASKHPADYAVERISEKLGWFRDSNAVRNEWVTESMARIDEGSYHPDWARLINEVEGVYQ